MMYIYIFKYIYKYTYIYMYIYIYIIGVYCNPKFADINTAIGIIPYNLQNSKVTSKFPPSFDTLWVWTKPNR